MARCSKITRVIADDAPDYPYRLEGRYAFHPVIGGPRRGFMARSPGVSGSWAKSAPTGA